MVVTVTCAVQKWLVSTNNMREVRQLLVASRVDDENNQGDMSEAKESKGAKTTTVDALS